MPPVDLNPRIAMVWRRESASVIAKVARMVRDVGQAEEIARDALVSLEVLGETAQAHAASIRASALTSNRQERDRLLRRAWHTGSTDPQP